MGNFNIFVSRLKKIGTNLAVLKRTAISKLIIILIVGLALTGYAIRNEQGTPRYFLQLVSDIGEISVIYSLLRIAMRAMNIDEYDEYDATKKDPFIRNTLLTVGILLHGVHVSIKFGRVIIETINIWGLVTIVIIIGIGLFIIREKQRLSYGIFEFTIGILAIVSIVKLDQFDFRSINFSLDVDIKLIGGLYIMVRGQDNIVKSFKGKKVGNWLSKRGIGN